MRLIIVMTAILLALNISSPIFAYQCKSPKPWNEELLLSTAVFSGKVIKIEPVQKDSFRYKVTFKITKLWKGNAAQASVVWMDYLGGSGYGFCDLEIKKGEHYLVYAYGEEDYLRVQLPSRGVGHSNRVLLLSKAAEDLSALEKLSKNPWKR